MKYLLAVTTLCAALFFVWNRSNAQSLSPEVISSSGDHFDNGSLQLSWTLGEPAIETYSTGSNKLTQGFHQTYLFGADPTCLLSIPSKLPVCSSTGNILSATTEDADVFTWFINSADKSWIITGGSTTAGITYIAGNPGVEATFTVIATNSLNGTSDTCQVKSGFQGRTG